jgi:hypothetical protein
MTTFSLCISTIWAKIEHSKGAIGPCAGYAENAEDIAQLGMVRHANILKQGFRLVGR